MMKITILSALLVCVSAAPGLYYQQAHLLSPSKSTFTSSSQVVDHGSTYHIPSMPVVPAYPVKSTLYAPAAKSTLTESSHSINHGGHAVVHAPVVQAAPVVHTAPVVHAAPVVQTHAVFPVQMSVLYSSPLYSLHRGDSAVSHHSSTVHETVPLLSSVYH